MPSLVTYAWAMSISGLDHINIDTCLPDETVAFYTDVLGLENRAQDRPNFDFPGAWLFAGDRAVVHLNFIEDGRKLPSTTGAFNHVAFEGRDFDAMCSLLDAKGLPYRSAARPEIDLKQIFVDDPNGVRVEINIRGE